MPRKTAIPPYRLHRGSGQAVVHLDVRDVYLGVHGSPESKQKYQEIIRKRRADKAKQEMEHPVRFHVAITIAELAARYLPFAEAYYRKNGKATSQVAIIKLALKVLMAKYSHLEAIAFGPLALKECQNALVAQGLARTEVNRRTGLIRQMFKWAVAMEMIPSSVLLDLQAVVGLFGGLVFGLVLGLIVGLVAGLLAGGAACLKHVVLRLWLIRNGSTPWNYIRFLDYAAERILLRKVGGSYVFLHRMLLEYFSARYTVR